MAILALEDGTVYHGKSFGTPATACGEVCFNTSMTGYQEILTDPSYKGQIVTMTYPEIGNCGVNPEDIESYQPHVSGFVVRELSPVMSSWRARQSLGDYLKENGIPGIEGIDTRALTRHIREAGALKAVLSSDGESEEALIRRARSSPGLDGRDLVRDVTCSGPHAYGEGGDRPLCVAYDLGAKRSIFAELAGRFDLEIVPAGESAEDVLARRPAAVFLSNGPGDPAALGYIVENVRKLLGRVPVTGICLGHQILGQALGGKTFKLKFGHHGANHPVQDAATRKVAITSQNHSFALDPDSLPPGIAVTHSSLNDATCEGLRSEDPRAFSVQYHPEACPGPHDARELFDQFFSFCVGE